MDDAGSSAWIHGCMDAWIWRARLGVLWEGEKAADVATWPSLPQPPVGWEWAINLKS